MCPSVASRFVYPKDATIPGTVYRVVRLLAEGGMGTVYEVEDITIGKKYVLKTLHSDLGDRADLARRMQSEARILAQLAHPNIVEVVTAGVTSDEARLPYYVMERLSGHNLGEVLRREGALSLADSYRIVIDLLDALDHAHRHGVVHRDVKPENIFLQALPSGDMQIKLLDFGVMAVLDGNTQTHGRFVGTLRYAAPEQLMGERAVPATDLYAAALVLFEMVAGGGPFDDRREPKEIADAHLYLEPPRLSSMALVPEVLDDLVASALSKNPLARPKDAKAMTRVLRGLSVDLTTPVASAWSTSRPPGDTEVGAMALLPTEAPMQGQTERMGAGGTLRLEDRAHTFPLPLHVNQKATTRSYVIGPVAQVPNVDTAIVDRGASAQKPTRDSTQTPYVAPVVRSSSKGVPLAVRLGVFGIALGLGTFGIAWTIHRWEAAPPKTPAIGNISGSVFPPALPVSAFSSTPPPSQEPSSTSAPTRHVLPATSAHRVPRVAPSSRPSPPTQSEPPSIPKSDRPGSGL